MSEYIKAAQHNICVAAEMLSYDDTNVKMKTVGQFLPVHKLDNFRCFFSYMYWICGLYKHIMVYFIFYYLSIISKYHLI